VRNSEKTSINPHSYGPDLYPVPVTLVTCEHEMVPNIIPICWTGVMSSDPPIVYISVRPSRFSYKLIETSRKFVINIPHGDMLETVDLCGKCSGRDTDKFLKFKLTKSYLIDSYPPVVAECKHHLFCDLLEIKELGTHHAFIAEVKFEMIDSDCIEGKTILFPNIRPIAYCPYNYAFMTDPVARFGGFKIH
jgi:flavin reductase (DIM6/NTAB) family NADH-FMN oxidoreductase RutF